IRVWDAHTGTVLCCFVVGRPVLNVGVARCGNWIATGDRFGGLCVLRFVSDTLAIAAVTRVHLYRYRAGHWDAEPTAECEWCGQWFQPSGEVVQALAQCPRCGQSLKLNSFIVDGQAQESKLQESQQLRKLVEDTIREGRRLAGEGRIDEARLLVEALPLAPNQE